MEKMCNIDIKSENKNIHLKVKSESSCLHNYIQSEIMISNNDSIKKEVKEIDMPICCDTSTSFHNKTEDIVMQVKAHRLSEKSLNDGFVMEVIEPEPDNYEENDPLDISGLKACSKKKWLQEDSTSSIIMVSENNFNENEVEIISSASCDEENILWSKKCGSPVNISNITNENPKYDRIRDCCFYCKTLVLNFSRHIQRCHPKEIEVQKIFEKPANSKERKHLISVIRKRGNFLMNSEKCIKPMKRSTQYLSKKLPCTKCLGFYSAKHLWRHRKRCTANSSNETSCQSEAQNFLIQHLDIDENLKEKVFPRMRADDISLTVKKDPLICTFGAKCLIKNRSTQHVNIISRKMRELAKLLIEIRKLDPSINTFLEALRLQNYNLIIEAAKLSAQVNSAKVSPTFLLNMGCSLKQCCHNVISDVLKRKNQGDETIETETNLKALIELLEFNWRNDVSCQADHLNIQKVENKTLIQLATDLKILQTYLSLKAKYAASQLDTNNLNTAAYNYLLETIFCQLMLLNRKFTGEIQRLTLQQYNNSEMYNNGDYSECLNAISPAENILMKKFQTTVIGDMDGHTVHVIFSRDVQEHIDLLIKYRANFIDQSNPYLFPKQNVDSYINSYHVLTKQAKSSGVENVEVFTTKKFKKLVGTMTQLYNMDDNDIEQLSNLIGLITGLNQQLYYSRDDIHKTVHITKLLLLIEKGAVSDYKGKTLEEIYAMLDEELPESSLQDSCVRFESQEDNSDIEEIYVDYRSHSENIYRSEVKNSKKKRTLVKWTSEQKKIVQTHFKKHIVQKTVPRKHEIVELINKYDNIFDNKTWLKIKVFVQNTHKMKPVL